MWKPEHRVAADRRCLRYPSDMIDTEWALVAPLIPPGRRGGRKRSVDVREVLNAIFYVLATGCQWQALPKDLGHALSEERHEGLDARYPGIEPGEAGVAALRKAPRRSPISACAKCSIILPNSSA